MAAKNSKGQALIEMMLVLALFLILWIFVQESFEKGKKRMNKWELGNETQTRFRKNLAK